MFQDHILHLYNITEKQIMPTNKVSLKNNSISKN